ncbi:MAG: GFA family protein [Maricaulaceae bacterium]
MKQHTGGCLCGNVRIEITGEPMTSGVCHCGQCQKNCGGNAAALMVFPTTAVKITKGKLRYFDTIADSGNKISRGFCSNCGTPIMSNLERTDEIIIVKLGAMDDPSFFTPTVVFWTSVAHSWATFPEGTVQFPENPPPLG